MYLLTIRYFHVPDQVGPVTIIQCTHGARIPNPFGHSFVSQQMALILIRKCAYLTTIYIVSVSSKTK